MDVNSKDNDGATPLDDAAEKGHEDVVRVLVTELNADVNSKDNKGLTPLHEAYSMATLALSVSWGKS